MDRELSEYYHDIFATYGTRGWQHIQQQLAEMLTSHNTLVGLDTEAQLHFRKGQLDIIAFMLNHQEQHEQTYNHLIAEETGGEAEAPNGGVAKVVDGEQEPE
jgi:hypothetical protein